MRFFRICSSFIMTLWFKTILLQSIFISKFLHILTGKIFVKYQSVRCLIQMKTIKLTLDFIHKAVLPLAFAHLCHTAGSLPFKGVKNRKEFKHLSRAFVVVYITASTKTFSQVNAPRAHTHSGMPLFILSQSRWLRE